MAEFLSCRCARWPGPPTLAIYLFTVQKWDAAGIGYVMTIGGIAAIVALPACAWIDRTHAKRLVVIRAET